MPFVVAVVIRIVLFLAGMIPLLRWVVHKAREAEQIPADRAVDLHVEAARGGTESRPPWFFGKPIHERATAQRMPPRR